MTRWLGGLSVRVQDGSPFVSCLHELLELQQSMIDLIFPVSSIVTLSLYAVIGGVLLLGLLMIATTVHVLF